VSIGKNGLAYIKLHQPTSLSYFSFLPLLPTERLFSDDRGVVYWSFAPPVSPILLPCLISSFDKSITYYQSLDNSYHSMYSSASPTARIKIVPMDRTGESVKLTGSTHWRFVFFWSKYLYCFFVSCHRLGFRKLFTQCSF